MKPPVESLVKAYRNSLYAAAFSVCKNPHDAEDVVQDTFVQYILQQKPFASEAHVRAWLLRVAINKAKNRATSFFRKNTLPLEDYAETLAFASAESSELFDAVMQLPEKYRIVIHLFYYEGYAVKEIAGILKLTPGNVRARLSRGRAMLRSTIKEGWDDDE